MKIYPNREKTTLYIRSMGKLLAVTSIFTMEIICPDGHTQEIQKIIALPN